MGMKVYQMPVQNKGYSHINLEFAINCSGKIIKFYGRKKLGVA